jgi:transposase
MTPTTPINTVLGIDLSKDWIDAALLPTGQVWHVPTSPDELETWIKHLPAGIDLVVMEASGGLQNRPAALLAQAGLAVAIVNPSQVRSFALSCGQRAKTDAIDAHMIARFGLAVKPQARALPSVEQAELSELLTRRQQIQSALLAEQNREKTARSKVVRKSIHEHVLWLQRRLDKIDEEIDQRIKGSPLWLFNEQLLTSVKGVGVGTARALQAYLPELGRLDRRQIGAMAGLAPYARESGKWRGRRSIYGGRAQVRKALYMAVLSAMQYNPVIRPFVKRLKDQGKPHKVAMCAAMRKLLTMLNAIIRDQQPWKYQAQQA